MASHDDSVNVIFGASVSGLLSGVNQVKDAIESIRSPVSELIEGFKGLAEVSGVAFAVEKIKELATEMAELGEHAVNVGASIGLSAEAFQNLSESMQLVGADGDTLVRTMRLLSNAVNSATTNDISRQADAFRAVGIDAVKFGETLRRDPIAALKQLAEAFKESGGAGGVEGPFGVLLGRGGASLIPFLAKGAEGVDELINEVKKLDAPSGKMLTDLKDLREAQNALTLAFTNFGATLTALLSGPLTSFTNHIKDNMVLYTDWLKVITRTNSVVPTGNATGPEGEVPEDTRQRYKAARGVVSDFAAQGVSNKSQVRAWLYANGYSEDAVNAILGNGQIESSFNPAAIGPGDHRGLFQESPERRAAGGIGNSTDIADQMELLDHELQKLDPSFRTAAGDVGELTKRFEKIFEKSGGQLNEKRVEAAHAAEAESAGGEGASGAVDFHNSAAEKKSLDEKLKNLDTEKKGREAQLNFELQAAKDDEASTAAIAQQKIALELEYQNARKALIGAASEQVRKTYQDEVAVGIIGAQKQALAEQQKAQAQRFKLADDEARHQEQIGNIYLAKVKGDLALQVEQGTITQAQATQILAVETEKRYQLERGYFDRVRALQDLTLPQQRTINAQIETLEAQHNARMQALDTQSFKERKAEWESFLQPITSAFATAINGLIEGTQTWAQAFQGILKTLLADFINYLAEKLAKYLAELAVEKAASLGSGVAGGVLGFIGKGLGALLAFGGGGVVPSAAGGWAIPSYAGGGIPAIVHSGEMILPANISGALQGAIAGGTFGGGGGHTFNMNISAWDAKSVMNSGPAIVASINNALRNGSQLRTA